MIRILIERDGVTLMTHETTADVALEVIASLSSAPPRQPMSAVETSAGKKRGGRPKKDLSLTRDDDGPAIRATKSPEEREEVKRLLKSSDLSPKEIAAKVGCEVGYIYMVRYAMKKAGELPAD